MKVIILCGGQGTRLREETEYRPKPLVEVGGRPILWHIMKLFAHHGFRDFVLALGYRGNMIKDYFLNYHARNSDFTVELLTHDVHYHRTNHNEDWQVTVAYTGERAMTGARIVRAAAYLGNAENFAVTYGDGLCNVDLTSEFEFHVEHGSVGTVLGINPPSRFGELKTDVNHVIEFAEKPELKGSWINGGYFFFRREFLDFLSDEDDCVLEQEPLSRLAREGQLRVFRHSGFWACMDTQRDKEYLEELWKGGDAPWVCAPERPWT